MKNENTTLIKVTVQVFQRIVLPGINGFILAGLLFAGLWPFKFLQKNNCRIQKQTGALEFSNFSFAYYKIPVKGSFLNSGSFTIELTIEPESEPGYLARILSAYTSRGEYLSILQWKSQLLFRMGQKEIAISLKGKDTNRFEVLCVFRQSEIAFCCNNKIRILDCKPIAVKGQNVTVVLGNSSAVDRQWIGKVHLLRIMPLTAYENGLRKRDTILTQKGDFLKICNNGVVKAGLVWPAVESQSEPQLKIPKFLFPLRPEILVPPWVDFRADWRYYIDVIVNYLGFIPPGFFFCALLNVYYRDQGKNIFYSITICFFISLFIEVSQVLLPTRSSQLSDLILNSVGGGSGSVVYVCCVFIANKIRGYIKMYW